MPPMLRLRLIWRRGAHYDSQQNARWRLFSCGGPRMPVFSSRKRLTKDSSPVLASWLLGCAAWLPVSAPAASETLVPDLPPVAQLAPRNGLPLEARVLDSSLSDPSAAAVTAGALDAHFRPFISRGSHFITAPLWFRLPSPGLTVTAAAGATPVLLARSGLDQPVEVFARIRGWSVALTPTTVVPQFGGAQDTVFTLPARAFTGPFFPTPGHCPLTPGTCRSPSAPRPQRCSCANSRACGCSRRGYTARSAGSRGRSLHSQPRTCCG